MVLKTADKEKNYITGRWEKESKRLRARARRLKFQHQLIQLVIGLCAVLLLGLLALPEVPRSLLVLPAVVIAGAVLLAYLYHFDHDARATQETVEALQREKALFDARVGFYADSGSAFARFVERCESLIGGGKMHSNEDSQTPAARSSLALPPASTSLSSRFGPFARSSGSTPLSSTRPNPFTGRPALPSSRRDDEDEEDSDSDYDYEDDEDDDELENGSGRSSLSTPFSRFRESPFSRSAAPPFGSSGRSDLRARLGGSDAQKGDEREADLAGVHSGNGSDGVHFAVNYPKEVRTGRWQAMTTYVYLAVAAEAVAADVRNQQSTQQLLYKRSKPTRQTIPEGALVTVTPYLKGFQFNPAQVSIGFYKDWHRFDFEMRATEMRLDEAANGYLSVTVEGVLVADLPLSVYVSKYGAREIDVMRMIVRKPYRALFASYSAVDTQIVERLQRVADALGLYTLRDMVQLKASGDPTDERLKLIEQADVFQLFWSHAAAESPEVAREWQYALRQFHSDPTFIRVVYWQQPMPALPEELRHAALVYQPELGL